MTSALGPELDRAAGRLPPPADPDPERLLGQAWALLRAARNARARTAYPEPGEGHWRLGQAHWDALVSWTTGNPPAEAAVELADRTLFGLPVELVDDDPALTVAYVPADPPLPAAIAALPEPNQAALVELARAMAGQYGWQTADALAVIARVLTAPASIVYLNVATVPDLADPNSGQVVTLDVTPIRRLARAPAGWDCHRYGHLHTWQVDHCLACAAPMERTWLAPEQAAQVRVEAEQPGQDQDAAAIAARLAAIDTTLAQAEAWEQGWDDPERAHQVTWDDPPQPGPLVPLDQLVPYDHDDPATRP